MDIIEIEGLTYRHPNGEIGLSNVDLKIRRGAFVVLAGPNGAGKTTLLRHLNGLLIAQSGRIAVDGRMVAKDPEHARRVVGMVFQDADSQIVGETVYDDAAFGPENLKWPLERVQKAVQQALAAVALSGLADRSPYLLSGGEKRRLAIAGVLAMDPAVIVLDEPFANLDYNGVRQVLACIVTLHRQGRTILLSAHDLEKVIAHAQRLILLDKGRIAADGEPGSVMQQVESYGVRMPCAIRLGRPVESWLS